MSRSEAIEFFEISRDSLYKWLKEYSDTGSFLVKKRKEYKPKKISKQALMDEINISPDSTLEEISHKFSCSQVAVWKRLKTLGITRKKTTLYVERNEKKDKNFWRRLNK